MGGKRQALRLGGRNRSETKQVARKLNHHLARPARTKPSAPRSLSTLRRVALEFSAPDASLVYVAGTFNDWDAHSSPLRSLKSGRWSIRLRLKPGKYEYRFLVDGVWKPDPMSRQYVTDFCGGLNSVLLVE